MKIYIKVQLINIDYTEQLNNLYILQFILIFNKFVYNFKLYIIMN